MVIPVKLFTPERVIVPGPVIVRPNPVPLIIPLIKRSFAVVPSSATLNVRVAPNATGQDIVASSVPVVASVTVTLPPKINKPLPVIEEPAMAPQESVTLVGEPSVKVDKARVDPVFTVNAPETVVLTPKVVEVELPMVRLLKAVDAEPLMI